MAVKIIVCGIRGGHTVDVTNTGYYYQVKTWKGSEIIDDDAMMDLDLSMMFSELAKIVEKLETKEDEPQ